MLYKDRLNKSINNIFIIKLSHRHRLLFYQSGTRMQFGIKVQSEINSAGKTLCEKFMKTLYTIMVLVFFVIYLYYKNNRKKCFILRKIVTKRDRAPFENVALLLRSSNDWRTDDVIKCSHRTWNSLGCYMGMQTVKTPI